MRILLVEDHEDTNRSLTSLLRRRGYQVQSALTFQSALELSAKGEFDVLISDLGLPDGSGIDLIQKLASKPPLGIALTGFGMEADIRKSREVGFHHHLVKPIDLNKLDALIQESAAAVPTILRSSILAPFSSSLRPELRTKIHRSMRISTSSPRAIHSVEKDREKFKRSVESRQ